MVDNKVVQPLVITWYGLENVLKTKMDTEMKQNDK
jgi:hypothetical protein